MNCLTELRGKINFSLLKTDQNSFTSENSGVVSFIVILIKKFSPKTLFKANNERLKRDKNERY